MGWLDFLSPDNPPASEPIRYGARPVRQGLRGLFQKHVPNGFEAARHVAQANGHVQHLMAVPNSYSPPSEYSFDTAVNAGDTNQPRIQKNIKTQGREHV